MRSNNLIEVTSHPNSTNCYFSIYLFGWETLAYNYYKKNTVICIEIKNLIIKVGDHFAYRQNDRWYKTRIVSIEENGQVIDETSNGRYGFEVEKAIPNNVCLYLIQKPK